MTCAPEGRPTIAQRFIAGNDDRKNLISPEGTTEPKPLNWFKRLSETPLITFAR
jgi:hypothetical protein